MFHKKKKHKHLYFKHILTNAINDSNPANIRTRTINSALCFTMTFFHATAMEDHATLPNIIASHLTVLVRLVALVLTFVPFTLEYEMLKLLVQTPSYNLQCLTDKDFLLYV